MPAGYIAQFVFDPRHSSLALAAGPGLKYNTDVLFSRPPESLPECALENIEKRPELPGGYNLPFQRHAAETGRLQNCDIATPVTSHSKASSRLV